MLLGAQLLGAAFAGLMWGIVVASVDTTVKWWEALAAIGTCLTALLAILIPWWQIWERDRTMKRAQAPRRHAAARSALEVASAISLSMNNWKEKKGSPHQDMLDAMLAKIELADSRIDDVDGSAILADLSLVVRALRTQVNHHSRVVEAPPAVLNICLRCDETTSRAKAWMKVVLRDFARLGLKAPAE